MAAYQNEWEQCFNPQRGANWRVHLAILRALMDQWMMVLSYLLVLQPHWMTLIKPMQQPQTDKDSFPMVYNIKWLSDCCNLVHSQHTHWYLAWQYPQWHLFGHKNISLKWLLWHLKVNKRDLFFFYLLKINLLFLHEEFGIKKVCEFGSFLDFDMVNSLSILYWAVAFSLFFEDP